MHGGDDFEMSDLEREVEFEMDDAEASTDTEAADDFEFESDSDSDNEFEMPENGGIESFAEFESDDGERESSDDFAQRFYELSTRDFEDEADLDREIGAILGEMERDYFWGGLKKRLKQGAKWGAKRLLQKAKSFGKGLPAFKALQGLSQLSRGNLKGFLSSLAKSGLSAALRAHPAGSAALSALKGLGFNPVGEAEANREGWNNFAAVAREAYEHLASNLDENTDNPMEASRKATAAFQAAVRGVQGRRGRSGGMRRQGGRAKVFRIRVPKGQTVKIVIEGV